MADGEEVRYEYHPMKGEAVDLPWGKHPHSVFVTATQDRLAKLMEKYKDKPSVKPYFYDVPANHVEMPQNLKDDLKRLQKRLRIEEDLEYLKAVYVAHSGPETPSWAILEPRMRKYLEYIYSKE